MFIESENSKSSPIFTTALALRELPRGIRAATSSGWFYLINCQSRSASPLFSFSLLFICASSVYEFALWVVLKGIVWWLLANYTLFHVVKTILESQVVIFISFWVQAVFNFSVVFINWWMCQRIGARYCTLFCNMSFFSCSHIFLNLSFDWSHCNLLHRLLIPNDLFRLFFKLTHIQAKKRLRAEYTIFGLNPSITLYKDFCIK